LGLRLAGSDSVESLRPEGTSAVRSEGAVVGVVDCDALGNDVLLLTATPSAGVGAALVAAGAFAASSASTAIPESNVTN